MNPYSSIKNPFSKLNAILAAILFGASIPFTKLLVKDLNPILLASLLYLGCGFGLLILRLILGRFPNSTITKAPLTLSDLPCLAGGILTGGVAAPLLLTLSLQNTPAATASLLLNFESVATSLIASLLFQEMLGKRVWMAVFLITLAGMILSFDFQSSWGFSPGSFGIAGACVFWGMDNNFTRKISEKNPLSIAIIKGIVAGSFSLLIAFCLGDLSADPVMIFMALILGFLSYGLSTLPFVLALRGLGAARTSAIFGTAPFIGVLISLFVFRQSQSLNFLIALPPMLLGAFLILKEESLS